MNLLLVAGFFCFAAFSSTFAHIGPPPICCLKVSSQLSKVNVNNVVDYKWQRKGVCPITAVVVTTRRGIKICADPNIDWTKEAMKKVDSMREEEKNKNTAERTPSSPAEGNREAPPEPTDTAVNSRPQDLPSPAAPADLLKAGEARKSGKKAQSSRKRGKGGKKRRIKSKAGKKKGKKIK